jgi:cytochrome c oxidase subunit 2
VRRANLPRLAAVALLIGVAFLLVSCGAGGDQNTFAPAGDVARKQKDLFSLALWPAIGVLILVEGVLVFALIRFRQRRDRGLPKQVHGNTRLEIAWTIAPAIVLAVLAVPMVMGVVDLGRQPEANAFGEPLALKVTGFQWNWIFEYPDIKDANGNPLKIVGTCPTDCAEAHIPVGREIGVSLESLDVIHSFWVPKLAGKLDVVPGRTNRMWLDAAEPGVYSGQCAEFCGLGHSDMRFFIVAESEEDFQAWVEEQTSGQQTTSPGAAQ